MHEYAILMNTCDAYSDMWEPFFLLLDRYWPDRNAPVYINTEHMGCPDRKDVTVLNLVSKNPSYTRRWREAVERIDSEYILVMLDDFFLTDYVNTEKFREALDIIKKDNNVGYLQFFKNLTNQNEKCEYDRFVRIPKDGYYRHSCQIALWRKETLLKCLDCDANPWQWEVDENKNSFDLPWDLYCADDFLEKLTFPYDCEVDGVTGGKWRLHTKELFRKEKIDIDFEKRGYYYPLLDSGHYKNIIADCRLYYATADSNFSESNTITAENPIPAHMLKDGILSFSYDLPDNIKGFIRLDPVNLGGIAMKNIAVRLTDKKGVVTQIKETDLGSTGVWQDGMLVFGTIDPDPQLYISFSKRHVPQKIDFECEVVLPVPYDTYHSVYGKSPDNSSFEKQRKIHRFF